MAPDSVPAEARVFGAPQLQGRFEASDFADELDAAPANRQIGSTLHLENESVRVFHIALEPGERCAFHVHDRRYFWTVTSPGRGLQRFSDGRFVVRDYRLGETTWLALDAASAVIHDLENVGETPLGFVTAELLE